MIVWIGHWVKFTDKQPEMEGDYLVCKDGKWRKAWWNQTQGYFMIHPESEIKAEEINIYDDYIPDYWSAISTAVDD